MTGEQYVRIACELSGRPYGLQSDAVRVSGKMARQLAGDDAVCAKNGLDRHSLRYLAPFECSVQLRIVIVDVLGKRIEPSSGMTTAVMYNKITRIAMSRVEPKRLA